ncbi:mannan endo-1,4-beta-mannosidase [Patella vulgata]|uniref:mannan endo-1,4-beta-mannosidase n=1 Tax=Patella vulgata TaxID=6465 RepID=UPI00217F5AA8|nr:mannan endo-1,4-beta-mannosidase [Patella vulgata]
MLIWWVAVLTAVCTIVESGRLMVMKANSGGMQMASNHSHFMKDGKMVFLSGVNLAWIHYAYDFGNGQFKNSRADMERYMKELHEAGGNSMRVWIFMQGESSPDFTTDGHVRALDHQGTYISDFKEMVALAKKYNILLFPCLWNGAVVSQSLHKMTGVIRDDLKRQSFIDNALIPLVKAVKGDPTIGGWDLMNEPEGLVNTAYRNAEPCFSSLSDGGGWAAKMFTYREFLKFFNWMAAAIKSVDSGALVTVGANNAYVATDEFGRTNFYKDECLIKAGGKKTGTLDFYTMHTYAWSGWSDLSPFKHSVGDYKLDKPLIVAEFSTKKSNGMTAPQLYRYVYDHGYNGAWTWAATDNSAGTPWEDEKKGVAEIRNEKDPLVAFTI